jgi:hypothetical protein
MPAKKKTTEEEWCPRCVHIFCADVEEHWIAGTPLPNPCPKYRKHPDTPKESKHDSLRRRN